LLTGLVEKDQLHVKSSDGKLDKQVPWNDKVIGLARQDRIFQEYKVKPGDGFSYQSYEPTITSVVTVRVKVKDLEEVEIGGQKQKLLRVETMPDKVKAANGEVQLPGMTSWLDKDLMPIRMQMEMPGLGQMILLRTSKEAALAAGPPPKPGEVDSMLKKNL